MAVTTVEGIGSMRHGLHPVQVRAVFSSRFRLFNNPFIQTHAVLLQSFYFYFPPCISSHNLMCAIPTCWWSCSIDSFLSISLFSYSYHCPLSRHTNACINAVIHMQTYMQERIAKSHGSQCGFCTPGIVMSMYTLLRNNPTPTVQQVLKGMSVFCVFYDFIPPVYLIVVIIIII